MIIVGLGNPGVKYERTRHNAGFMVVDYFAECIDVKIKDKGFSSLYGTTSVSGERIILAKPQTYMNLSGEAVKGLASYYKESPENILIIYDDIELPLGQIRIRKEGSGGTHNGMKNIIQELGSTNIKRIRVGLGVDKNMDLKDYVLERLPKDQMEIVDKMKMKISEGLVEYIKDKDFDKLMQRCNGLVK